MGYVSRGQDHTLPAAWPTYRPLRSATVALTKPSEPSFAMVRAIWVLPEPAGPSRRIPVGMDTPRAPHPSASFNMAQVVSSRDRVSALTMRLAHVARASTVGLAAPLICRTTETKSPDPPSSLPANRCASIEIRSEEHTSELQSLRHLVCRLLLEDN